MTLSKLARQIYRFFISDKVKCENCQGKFAITYYFSTVNKGLDNANYCPHCGTELNRR